MPWDAITNSSLVATLLATNARAIALVTGRCDALPCVEGPICEPPHVVFELQRLKRRKGSALCKPWADRASGAAIDRRPNVVIACSAVLTLVRPSLRPQDVSTQFAEGLICRPRTNSQKL